MGRVSSTIFWVEEGRFSAAKGWLKGSLPLCRRPARSGSGVRQQERFEGKSIHIPPFATKQKLAEQRELQSQRTGHPTCFVRVRETETLGHPQQRGPISKQRNPWLQTALIEAAKLAPRWNPQLAALHARELERGPRNRATLADARKLAAYLLAVDKQGQPFQPRTLSPIVMTQETG